MYEANVRIPDFGCADGRKSLIVEDGKWYFETAFSSAHPKSAYH